MPSAPPSDGLWLRLASRFVPADVRADPTANLVSRMALAIFLATIFAGLFFGAIHFLTLPPATARLVGTSILGCAVAGALGPLLLRRFGPAVATHSVLCYCFAALSVLVFCLGGAESPQMYWLIAVPVPAILAFGWRGAWWLGATLAEAAVLWGLHVADVRYSGSISLEVAREKWVSTAIGATIYFTIQFWVFASVQLGATRALRETRGRLELARAEAEAANRAKSSFLANVSHKLRTPLTAVLGHAQLALLRGASALGAEAEARLGAIARNGRHLLGIIDDILDVSKLEAGRVDIQPERVTLRAALCDVLALMRGRAHARGLALVIELANPVPAEIETDPKRLRQILFNLLGNAIKFTRQGRVTLRVGHTESLQQPRIWFSVEDTGIGMTREQVARLFQPFTQADASTAREYGGTGLGLSICKRFAELMGGTVSVATALGAGSAFRLELPAGAVESAARLSEPSELERGPESETQGALERLPLRVALGDTHADNRELARALLEAAGASVESHVGMREALAAAVLAEQRGEPFDALVVDVPPYLLATTAALRELRRRVRVTPVIAISTGAYARDREVCLAAGFDAYVTKPLDPAELVRAIHGTVESPSHARETRVSRRAFASAEPGESARPRIGALAWLDSALFPIESETHGPLRYVAVHGLLACAWLAIGFLAWRTRGIESPLGYWLYLLPVVAVAQVGTRGAVVWAALCIAQFLAFFRLSQLGHSFPDFLVGDVRVAACLLSFAATAIAVVGFAFRYAQRTNRMLNELAATNASLEEARDAAARADASKTDFLANISHEIRTPMTAILGFAELIAEGAAGRADSAASHSLAAVQRNGAELLRTIDDLLDLSKFEAGRLHVERLQLSPTRLAAEALARLRPHAEARGLALELRLDGAVPESIQSDPTRLRQILSSLVANAVRFTHSGRVTVHLGLAADPNASPELRCEVRDTGPGIAPETLARIRALFDVERPVATEYRGAGLGLAVCRRLLVLLGGRLEVESEPGRGSTLRFAVPTGSLAGVRLVSQVDEPSAAAENESLPAGARVLLAEDGPDNQKLIRAVLERAGARVTLAGDGAQALELVAAAEDADAPFDVILMDMHMPEVDGHEATRRLRARGFGGPIVALTALGPREARERCLAAGCDDFLGKPIDRQSLLATVARFARAGKNRDTKEPT